MDDPVLEALRQSGKLSDDDFRFLRDFGQRYRAQRLPSGLKRQKSGACLDVADQLEREGRGRYVRGFALNPTGALHGHGWVTANNVSAIDATWPTPERCAYFGIRGHRHKRKLARISRPWMARSLFAF